MLQIVFGVFIIFLAAFAVVYIERRPLYKKELQHAIDAMNKIRLCKNCTRIYGYGKADLVDQCEVPSCGISVPEEHMACAAAPDGSKQANNFIKAVYGHGSDIQNNISGAEFIHSHMKYVHFSNHSTVYGHPSQLNVNNDCYFYLPQDGQKNKLSTRHRISIFIKCME